MKKSLINKKIKKSFFKIIRKFARIYLIGNLGKVVEDNDKIICYVDKRKCQKGKYSYKIICRGIKDTDMNLAKLYRLDKPVYYIIDGFNFENKNVTILGYSNCHVNIKNCRFAYGVDVWSAGECALENTYIKSIMRLNITADELTLKNMYLNNEYNISSKFDINLSANKKLMIIDSQIGKTDEKTKVSLFSTDKIKLINTKIAGDDVECETKNFISDANSFLGSKENIHVKVDDLNYLNFSAPMISYNDNILVTKKSNNVLRKEENSLENKRLEFIEVLKKLRGECNNILIEQSVSKILSKKYKF